jgi:hypothetical protein
LITQQDYGMSSNLMKDYTISSYELDLESCIRILKKKDQTPLGQRVNEMNNLTIELFTKKEEVERLQQEIKTLKNHLENGTGVSSGINAELSSSQSMKPRPTFHPELTQSNDTGLYFLTIHLIKF